MDQDQSALDPHAESEAVLELRKELVEKANRLRDAELADYIIREKINNLCMQQRHLCHKQQESISQIGMIALVVLFAGFCGTVIAKYPTNLLGVTCVVLSSSILTLIGGKSIVIRDKLAEIDRFAVSEGLMNNERTRY